uniref:Uncharacterized protein n=1 Tax=Timema cristinae TaxID=61476 RepID=A0A7R9CWQ2_TIMCR|nr:unnamed protein product [Timema cristinae]
MLPPAVEELGTTNDNNNAINNKNRHRRSLSGNNNVTCSRRYAEIGSWKIRSAAGTPVIDTLVWCECDALNPLTTEHRLLSCWNVAERGEASGIEIVRECVVGGVASQVAFWGVFFSNWPQGEGMGGDAQASGTGT